jgi:ABC-type multidrug transport system ATPase subunit
MITQSPLSETAQRPELVDPAPSTWHGPSTAESESPAAIRAVGVGRRFGRLWAVKGADLTVGWGEVVGLLGPNGSGKTTLLRILAGVLTPTEGRAQVGGIDVVGPDRDRVRERVGIVSGDAYLYGDLTAAENMRLALAMLGRSGDRELVRRTLETVGLTRAMNRRVRDFSTGMRKRLALARAIAGEPAVLLLDEPYSGLDEQGVRFVHDVVDCWRIEGRALLMATHHDVHAAERCDRCVLLGPEPGTGRPEAPVAHRVVEVSP